MLVAGTLPLPGLLQFQHRGLIILQAVGQGGGAVTEQVLGGRRLLPSGRATASPTPVRPRPAVVLVNNPKITRNPLLRIPQAAPAIPGAVCRARAACGIRKGHK